jgi:type IV secretory pathway VirB10-like protein
MSALWTAISDRVERSETPTRSRPTLRPVRRPRTRLARLPFVIVLIGIFALGMTGLLMLNTTLQGQAFEARRLDTQSAQLGYTEASLQRQVDQLRSPASQAQRASSLGMRANPSPAFLLLPSGKIIGEANPVRGDEQPSLIVKSDQQIQAEEAAAKARKAAAERAAAEKAATEAKKKAAEAKVAAAKKAAADKAAATKAAADKAAKDKAAKDKAAKDKAAKDKAAAAAKKKAAGQSDRTTGGR